MRSRASRLLFVAALLPLLSLWLAAPALSVAAFLLVVSLLAALPVVVGGGPLFWRVIVAVVVAVACAAAAALPAASLGAPLVAQAGGAGPLALARAAPFACSALLLPLVARRRRLGLALLLAASFLSSWLSQLALIALAGCYAWVAFRARSCPRGDAPRVAYSVVLLGVVAGLALALRPDPPPPPRSHPEAARSWMERDNPWRALPHARAWAANDGEPAGGVVMLARIAARLGDLDDARALLVSVKPTALDARARREADELAATLRAR